MRDIRQLFVLEKTPEESLTSQIRSLLIDAITGGRIPSEDPLPSTRELSRQLGVSRNLVVKVYSDLADDGILYSKPRSGYFVNASMAADTVSFDDRGAGGQVPATGIDWKRRYVVDISTCRNIEKPDYWRDMAYPFIYGQVDFEHFPFTMWRDCSRLALSIQATERWGVDNVMRDDPDLVEQIRTRLLPRRGITAAPEEILVTVGSQNALYILAELFIDRTRTAGIEDPGYPDVRNLFMLRAGKLRYLPLDDLGLRPDRQFDACDVVYVTPSHQVPTGVTMPYERRKALLERAAVNDTLVIEDDYDSEINFSARPNPALRSMDRSGNVIYVASMSKTLAPGLRLGYMVAPEPVIKQARALRRLMLRYPALNNQRMLALFLAHGGYDMIANKLKSVYRERWSVLTEAVDRLLPSCKRMPASSGTAVWLRGPEGLDCYRLERRAAEAGIVVEPGAVFFGDDAEGRRYFRLGISVISSEKIVPGITALADLIEGGASAQAAE